jgi:hypothetical protein
MFSATPVRPSSHFTELMRNRLRDLSRSELYCSRAEIEEQSREREFAVQLLSDASYATIIVAGDGDAGEGLDD